MDYKFEIGDKVRFTKDANEMFFDEYGSCRGIITDRKVSSERSLDYYALYRVAQSRSSECFDYIYEGYLEEDEVNNTMEW